MPMRRKHRPGRVALVVTLLGLACTSFPPAAEGSSPLQLSSPSFSGTIPERYASCSGQTGNSPALAWGAPPSRTRSFALIVTDPDAPMTTFTHWLIWDLPADTRSLPEGVPTEPQLRSGARQGRNGFGRIGYGGPCPPGGAAHRYVFTVYALDARLDLAPGATRQQLVDAMERHVLAAGELIGRYQR